MEKRRNCSLGAISPLFHIILYIHLFLTSGVKLHIHLLNVVVQFIVFLTLSTLICRGTDISKCFNESFWIQDNESRLYLPLSQSMCSLIRIKGCKVSSCLQPRLIRLGGCTGWFESSMEAYVRQYIFSHQGSNNNSLELHVHKNSCLPSHCGLYICITLGANSFL